MTDFKKGDVVRVQPDKPGSPTHVGVCSRDSKGGFTIVRIRGTSFLISNSRISKES